MPRTPIVEIPDVCDQRWEDMDARDDKSRFCHRCQKAVFDLSAMTESEARVFLEENAYEPCVNFITDAFGAPVYKPEPRPRQGQLQRQLDGALRLLATAALAMPLMACDHTTEAPATPESVAPVMVEDRSATAPPGAATSPGFVEAPPAEEGEACDGEDDASLDKKEPVRRERPRHGGKPVYPKPRIKAPPEGL